MQFKEKDVFHLLIKMNTNIAASPDGFLSKLIKKYVPKVSLNHYHCSLINRLKLGSSPKMKNGRCTENYRPCD